MFEEVWRQVQQKHSREIAIAHLRPLHHALWATALILPQSCGTFVVDVASHKHSFHLWNSFDTYVLKLYPICIDMIIYPPAFIDARTSLQSPGLPDTRRHNMRHPHVAAHEACGIMWIPPKSDVTRSHPMQICVQRQTKLSKYCTVHINSSSRERNDVNPTNKRTHRILPSSTLQNNANFVQHGSTTATSEPRSLS